MSCDSDQQQMGLELILQHPGTTDLDRIPKTRGREGEIIYPEMDADGDHVHFEMVPMRGDSMLWLTIRRAVAPETASAALRKIADLIDRHGDKVLSLLNGEQGSFSRNGELVEGPLKLKYDENGDLIIPPEIVTTD